jgi:hypothetical protein
MNKSAKEMFEELGYKQETLNYGNEDENIIDEIIYKKDYRFASNVTFRLNNKCFKIHRKNESEAGWCDMPLFQAINKQIEELHWDD